MSDWRELSLALEAATGFDSIPTVEDKYDRTEAGAIGCCWPDCKVVRRQAESMWAHVHFGPHGLSFGVERDFVKLRALVSPAPTEEG